MTDAGGEGDIRGGDHYEEVLRGENFVSISQKGEGDITSAKKGGRRLADCLISQVRGSVVSGTRTLGQ